MKAVEADFTAYSDEQWNDIKAYLARFGVDADAALRAELEQLGARYVEHSRLKSPPQRLLEKQREDTHDKIKAVRRMFDPGRFERFFLSPDGIYKSGDELADAAHRVLSVIERQLSGSAPNFYDYTGEPIAGNSELESRNIYLVRLLKIWRKLVGNKRERGRASWLSVCAAPFKNFNKKKIDYLLHHGLPRNPKTRM